MIGGRKAEPRPRWFLHLAWAGAAMTFVAALSLLGIAMGSTHHARSVTETMIQVVLVVAAIVAVLLAFRLAIAALRKTAAILGYTSPSPSPLNSNIPDPFLMFYAPFLGASLAALALVGLTFGAYFVGLVLNESALPVLASIGLGMLIFACGVILLASGVVQPWLIWRALALRTDPLVPCATNVPHD